MFFLTICGAAEGPEEGAWGCGGEQVGSQPLRGVRFGPLDTPSVTVGFRQVLDPNEVWVLFYNKSKPRASSPGLVLSDPGGGGVGGVVTLRRDF